ncbi:MAG: hypothetical protein LBU60_06185 [Clostridiales bacterium]|jgi:hypothetical protein|nr:hypothetical protein [Clostridiales bacterium]
MGESVLLLDEFDSSLEFNMLLKILDGHPIRISSRYFNKQAAFTTVYIISNNILSTQYPNIRTGNPAKFDALMRRLTGIYNFDRSRTYNILDANRKQVSMFVSEKQDANKEK